MQYKSILSALVLGLAFTSEVAAQRHHRHGGSGFGNKTSAVAAAASSTLAAAASSTSAAAVATSATSTTSGSGANADALALNPAVVQSGSDQDGTTASGADAAETPSATDPANFINFCLGKTLTNGLQVTGGSCNGIVMGDIPSNQNMVSTVITNPTNGEDIAPNETFNFSATAINMVFGAFTNADATYYSAPQALDPKTGNIIGHLHFSVQSMPDANTKTPLDPVTFAFFKGVNDAGDGKGDLNAVVTGGLAAGTYRVCTMTSAANHQPVLMPVAKRGPQDDCIRFTVGGGGGGGGAASSSAVAATSAAATSAAAASTTTSAAATATSAASNSGSKSGTGKSTGNKGGDKGGKKGGKKNSGGSKSTQSGCDQKAKRAVHVEW